jgi:hypothetical protein
VFSDASEKRKILRRTESCRREEQKEKVGYCIIIVLFCFLWRCGPTRATAPSFLRFLDHTQRHITVGRTPLDEWSARRRDLYLTTHNTHYRQTSMPPVGFEPTISAGERPQTLVFRPSSQWDWNLSSFTYKYLKGEKKFVLETPQILTNSFQVTPAQHIYFPPHPTLRYNFKIANG